MTDDDTIARIRDVLDASPRIDAARVEVSRDGGDVVLRGAVATPEESSVAAMIVEGKAADAFRATTEADETLTVRNELRVDAGLREVASEAAASADAAESEVPPPPPGEAPPDLTTDAHDALSENVAWDPPDAPSFAPTRGEELGRPQGASSMPDPAPAGAVDGEADTEPSASDLSAADLERSARVTENASENASERDKDS